MTAERTRSEIERLTILLLEENLAIATRPAIIRSDETVMNVTWANAPRRISDLFRLPFASIPEYYRLVTAGQFNMILIDGGLLQFNYVYSRQNLIRHRLLYYPCPINIPQQEISEFAVEREFADLFKLYLETNIDDLRNLIQDFSVSESNMIWRSKSPIRFDFNTNSASRHLRHSHSHAHLNDPNCRIGASGPLSVGHFVRFIFTSFYPEICNRLPDLSNWQVSQMPRTINAQETQVLYLDCAA